MAKRKTKQEKMIQQDLIKIAIFVAALVIVYFIGSVIFKQLNTFEYQGLKFTKERYDKLPVYRYYYYFNTSKGEIFQYNLYLLHDPRKNNVTIEGDPIIFKKKVIYVAIDTDRHIQCPDNLVGIIDLNRFLDANQFEVKAAVTNKTYAELNNQSYASCIERPNSEVIELFSGNETKIIVNGNCHRIIIGPDCRVREAIEKFKVRVIIDAKNYDEIPQ